MKLKRYTMLMLLALAAIGIMPITAQDEASCADGGHLIEHDMGQTCVPAGVERVVALEWTLVEDVLALGMQPVGVADIEGYNSWLDIPMTLFEDVADVGTRQEPNLEQIIVLEPDLIIAASFRVTENYDDLSAIAPTIAFNAYPADGASHYDGMIDTFNTIALVTGREAEAEVVLEQVQATYDAAATAIEASDLDNKTFILAQSFLSGDAPVFRLFTDNAMAVEIMRQIGLENAWDDAPQQYGFTTVDFEGFATIEDTLFFYIAQSDDHDAIVDAPVWGALPFVTAGHDYWLGGDVWLFGGPLSAITLVETITESLGLELPADAPDTTSLECEAGYRLYTHDLLWEGTADGVCIPEEAQRVVVANHPTYLLDNVLALGVQPVGMAIYLDRFAVAPYLGDYVEGITEVGSYNEPNLEVILGLEPDLILSTTFREDYYDQLSAIAPTILLEWDQVHWQDFLLATGDALNRSDEALTLLDEYEFRVEIISETLAGLDELPEISVVRVRPDNIRYYVVSSLSGQVLQDVGLPRPEVQNIDEEDTLFQKISMEAIDQADGDMIFVWGATDGSDDAIAELEANPLWQQLSGVQNDQVYYVDEEHWFAPGIIGVHLLLDDILTLVADVDPDDVSPNPYLTTE